MFDYDMTKDQILAILSSMDKAALRQCAREEGIKLYTTVPEKMRVTMCNTIYGRLHHGDAFWQ